MIKLEKRDVYVKEFWSMSYFNRYIYSMANVYANLIMPEINPLKWSISTLWHMFLVVMISMLTPIVCLHEARRIKSTQMPDCDDPMFKGGDNWRSPKRWVVKNEKL